MTATAAARVDAVLRWLPLGMVGTAFGLAASVWRELPWLLAVLAGGALLTTTRRETRVRLSAAWQRQFPATPRSWWPETIPKLIVGAFCLGAFVLLTRLKSWPPERVLSMEALLFQFGGAALLWWESNNRDFKWVVIELERTGRAPGTPGERVLLTLARLSFTVPMLLSFLMLLLVIWLAAERAASLGWQAVETPEFQGAVAIAAMITAAFVGNRFVETRSKKVAQAIAQARAAKDDWGYPGEDEQIARRAVRTIGFALVAVGTLLQIYPVWVG